MWYFWNIVAVNKMNWDIKMNFALVVYDLFFFFLNTRIISPIQIANFGCQRKTAIEVRASRNTYVRMVTFGRKHNET